MSDTQQPLEPKTGKLADKRKKLREHLGRPPLDEIYQKGTVEEDGTIVDIGFGDKSKSEEKK